MSIGRLKIGLVALEARSLESESSRREELSQDRPCSRCSPDAAAAARVGVLELWWTWMQVESTNAQLSEGPPPRPPVTQEPETEGILFLEGKGNSEKVKVCGWIFFM